MKGFGKIKKIAAVITLTIIVFTGAAFTTGVVTHVGNCSSQSTTVDCDNYKHGVIIPSHLLYESVNGSVYCIRTAICASHKIRCSNLECNVVLDTQERTCEIIHQYCPRETGLCQY